MENKHYEYKVIQRVSLDCTEDMLNMYGKQGWELVGYIHQMVCL